MSWPLILLGGIAAYLLLDKTVSKARDALHGWEPADDWSKEIDYRADLAMYLREELPDAFVVEEHGHGRGRRDIRIENKESEVAVAVELKYNLKSSNEVNRLLGQIIRYKQDVEVMFLILINSEPNQLAEVEKQVAANFDEDTVEILVYDSNSI